MKFIKKIKTAAVLSSIATAMVTSGCASSVKDIESTKNKKVVTNDLFKQRIDVASNNINGLVTKSNKKLPHGSYLDFPKNADSGQCFAQVSVPAKYKYRAEKVLVKPQSKIIKTVPAKYKMVSQNILVKEASTSLKAIPATYKKVSEQIMVSEPREIIKTHPPVYKTVKEKVLVRSARKVWKIGREWKKGSLATKYANSGEIRCLVEEPAVYKTITKKVLSQPARTETVQVPAVYKTIVKTVLDEPAKTIELDVPEVVKTVKVRKMVTEPSSFEETIPPVYKTVKRKIITQEPYQRWTKILCRTNDKSSTVRNLQAKLKKLGYYNQAVDGVVGPSTHNAVRKFQTERLGKAHYNGRITFDTLRNLKIL